MENKKENFSPIVKLKRLDLQDLLLKGVRIIKDETLILQEEIELNVVKKIEGRRTRPKVTKKYFDESEPSDSEEEYPDTDYEPEDDKPKLKNRASNRKRYFVEEDSESGASDSKEEYPDTDNEPENDEPKLKNKASKHKPEKLTEYERMIQKNKDEKMAFLDSLKINEIKGSFAEAVRGLKTKRKFLKKHAILTPRINQQRSAKIGMDLSEEALQIKAMTPAIKEKRKTLPQVLTFEDALDEKDLYEDFTNDFHNLEEYSKETFKNYDSHFQKMQLLRTHHSSPTKRCSNLSLSFHPMREKLIIASSACRYGKIGLWNVNSHSESYVFEVHTEGITHLKFNYDQPNILVSSSYDGTLRCCDLEKRVFNEVYQAPEETSCTHFDFVSPQIFLVSQKNGNVSVVDVRENSKTSSKTLHCHDHQIKSISVHPLDKKYFISAINDGLIRLWDLRRSTARPVSQFNNLTKGVITALFSPLTGKHILTSSRDTVGLYDSPDFTKSIPRNEDFFLNKIERGSCKIIKNTMKATWLPNSDDLFITGSKHHTSKVEIYNSRMKYIFGYNGVVGIIFHPSLPVLAGFDLSGRISILTDRDAQWE